MTVAIRCGRLIDVEAGSATVDQVIHVDDAGRVTGVGAHSDGVPDEAIVVDLSGLSVVPGLIDTHTHLVGDVQTAFVPSTTSSAAEEVLFVVAKGGSVVIDRRGERAA